MRSKLSHYERLMPLSTVIKIIIMYAEAVPVAWSRYVVIIISDYVNGHAENNSKLMKNEYHSNRL